MSIENRIEAAAKAGSRYQNIPVFSISEQKMGREVEETVRKALGAMGQGASEKIFTQREREEMQRLNPNT